MGRGRSAVAEPKQGRLARPRTRSRAAVSTHAASARSVDPADRFETFQRENLNVHYLATKAQVEDAVAWIKKVKPAAIGLDFETASKNGRWGASNGSIRLIQIDINEPGVERQQFLIDCHRTDPDPFIAILASPKIESQIHNMKFECEWAGLHLGTAIGKPYCTLIAWRCIQKHLREVAKKAGYAAAHEIEPGWKPNDELADDPHEKHLRAVACAAAKEATDALVPGWDPGDDGVLPGKNHHDNKLSTLLEHYLEMRMPKEEQSSDWGRDELEAGQLIYAATDPAVMPHLVEVTKKAAAACGAEVESKIDFIIGKEMQTVADRVERVERANEDDSVHLGRALKRAASSEEIDRIWELRRQLVVLAPNSAELEKLYNERRNTLQI